MTESSSRRLFRSSGYWVGMVRTLMARAWVAKPEDLLCKNYVNRNLRVRADTKAAYPNNRLPYAGPYCFFMSRPTPIGLMLVAVTMRPSFRCTVTMRQRCSWEGS